MSGVICNMLHTRCATSALSSTIDVISRASLSATCQSHSSPLVWVAFLPGLNFLFPHPLIFSAPPQRQIEFVDFLCEPHTNCKPTGGDVYFAVNVQLRIYPNRRYGELVVTLVQYLLSRNYSQVSFKIRNLFNDLYNLKIDRKIN